MENREPWQVVSLRLSSALRKKYFADVQWCLSDWECMNASLCDERMAVYSIPEIARLCVVYAGKDRKNTLALCEQLRGSPGNFDIPILLAVSRYELSQGNAVERMGNAAFIISPFDQDELRGKTTELLKSCW